MDGPSWITRAARSGNLSAGVFRFVDSYVSPNVLYEIADAIIPLRVTAVQEEQGLDLSQHGEFVAPIELPEDPVSDLKQPA